jgi:hypothetical protein
MDKYHQFCPILALLDVVDAEYYTLRSRDAKFVDKEEKSIPERMIYSEKRRGFQRTVQLCLNPHRRL